MAQTDPPAKVASNDQLGLAPEREGQPRTMVVIDGEREEETGHWYSPAAVREMLAADRQAAWDAVDAWIKPGALGGNGCDQTAQRNGLILAANVLMGRIEA